MSSTEGDGNGFQAYIRVTIRDDNHMVESIEFVVSGAKALHDPSRPGRRAPRAALRLGPGRTAARRREGQGRSEIARADPRRHGPARVSRSTRWRSGPTTRCTSSVAIPSWSTRRQIVDILDVASPPHRMFAAVYPAKDKRHVVLMQAHTFNANLARWRARASCSTPRPRASRCGAARTTRRWRRSSCRACGSTRLIFTDTPAKDRTGYLLETPEGTFPALAVNGTLTDAELHGLVDSLVRARPK